MNKNLAVKESQIEDVLATYPDILRELLNMSGEITLIGRQKILPSGNRIDLLFISGKEIMLVDKIIDALGISRSEI